MFNANKVVPRQLWQIYSVSLCVLFRSSFYRDEYVKGVYITTCAINLLGTNKDKIYSIVS